MMQSYKVLLPINQNYDKIWEETRHPFYIFIQIKKQQLTQWNARQQCMCMMCSDCANLPFNYFITIINYEHDVCTVLLVLKLGWW